MLAYLDRLMSRLSTNVQSKLSEAQRHFEILSQNIQPILERKMLNESHRLQLLSQRIQAQDWGKGYTTAKPLQFDEFGITGIAVYLVKSPILGKRWSASRNLEQPKTSERDGRIPQYKIREFGNSGNDNRAELELAGCKPYYNEINGGYYITVRMYKKPAPKRSRKRGKL